MIDWLFLRPPFMGVRALVICCAVATGLGSSTAARAEGEAAAWEALRQGGHVAIMRHSIAPGFDDPPGFKLDDCATQRNLSADGRALAEKIGEAFRSNTVAVEKVYSSQWCRSLETARLLDLGDVDALAALNSFPGGSELGDAQMAALWAWLLENKSEGTLVLVTHQVVVGALTGVIPRMGETVVFRVAGEKALVEAGRIPPP